MTNEKERILVGGMLTDVLQLVGDLVLKLNSNKLNSRKANIEGSLRSNLESSAQMLYF